MTKALVIVDMLNDFVQENGALPVKGAKDLVENIAMLAEKARAQGITVVYANDAHAPDDKEFKLWPKHCVKDTYGAQVVEKLKPQLDDLVITKQDLSLFTNPDAEWNLTKRLGKLVQQLYITGVATEYCVGAAALDARKLGYTVNVVVDAIAGVDLQKGDQYKALIEMGNAGVRPIDTKTALEELVR